MAKKLSFLKKYVAVSNSKKSMFPPPKEAPQVRSIKDFPLKLKGLNRSIYIVKIETYVKFIVIIKGDVENAIHNT